MEFLRLIKLERIPSRESSGGSKHGTQIISSTNMTILNFLLVHLGPMHEQTLCTVMAGVQILGSLTAFGIRYGVGSWFYGGDRR